MEDTGIYGKRLLVALCRAGWHCAVEKTTILDKIRPEHHRKDDTFDARLLVEYGDRFRDRLHLSKPPEQALEAMSQLYSERRRLVRQHIPTVAKSIKNFFLITTFTILEYCFINNYHYYE